MKSSCWALALSLASTGLYGCGGADSSEPAGTGGSSAGTGGTSSSGGSPGSGGAATTGTGGGVQPGTGGASPGSGGAVATGGVGTGGTSSAGGGSATGGAVGSGGAAGGAVVGGVPLDPSLLSRCSGTSPILCTIPVPANGDFNVTVELGSATAASTSRVQAETYRIVVPEMTLPAGTFSQQTFSVNVRAESHGGYSAPARELNLRIDGAAPAMRGLGFAAAPSIPTIFIAGDSTVCDWDPVYTAATPATAGPNERGWGQELSQFLKPGIAVANYADSGETSTSFYGGFWGPAKAALRAGDYVFVQFGHNDQKPESGLTPASFKTAMMRYITDARTANATPVLLTPPGRKTASLASPGFAGFDQATRELAQSASVALVDLTMLSITYYNTLPDKSVVFANPTEATHFGESGATALSKLITTALKTATSPGTAPLRDFIK
jgi:lysophospholipase L1-like esterase